MTPLTQTSSGTPALSSTIAPSVNLDATSWTRRAYYNAETSHADGLVFLNNHGGAGSGVFDYAFGMSLSYASTDSTTAAVSPQVLADTLLNDSIEVSIWTDQQCQGEACGYYRPGTVAYHGFSGASKMFLMEFDMPFSNNTISSWEHPNPDMPAIWALNADIARTQQYGNCSCWATGCGEWDIFEAVSPGDFRLSSCVHANPSGCEGAWFQRPENKTIKAAVIFDGTNNAGNIYLLPDETDFPTTISGTTVAGFGSGDGNVGNGVLPGAVSTYAARVFDLANQGASR
ncbi:target of Sbf [Neophaeococcomyces mojaviensis]|uniref:Target of Sbf n=1 Tax=Neophaeococcomyces mojaviensis TaxID=3383035 RepID=A0ACC3AA92_9EURO|nr:target of Sbf [Knufia sp. JES_112]